MLTEKGVVRGYNAMDHESKFLVLLQNLSNIEISITNLGLMMLFQETIYLE